MLYIFNKSFSSDVFQRCLEITGGDDAILLIENAVLWALNSMQMCALAKNTNIYILQSDLIARGIGENISSNLQIIDYEGFVHLTLKHSPIISVA